MCTETECPYCGELYEGEFHMCRDTQDGDIMPESDEE